MKKDIASWLILLDGKRRDRLMKNNVEIVTREVEKTFIRYGNTQTNIDKQFDWTTVHIKKKSTYQLNKHA